MMCYAEISRLRWPSGVHDLSRGRHALPLAPWLHVAWPLWKASRLDGKALSVYCGRVLLIVAVDLAQQFPKVEVIWNLGARALL